MTAPILRKLLRDKITQLYNKLVEGQGTELATEEELDTDVILVKEWRQELTSVQNEITHKLVTANNDVAGNVDENVIEKELETHSEYHEKLTRLQILLDREKKKNGE